MWGYILLSGAVYVGLQYPEFFNDMMYYCQMKTDEYMGLYSYEIHIEDSCDTVSQEHPQDDSEDGLSLFPTAKDHLMEIAITLYFEAMRMYSYAEMQWRMWTSTYTIARHINNAALYLMRKWHRITCPYCLEPEEKEWVDSVTMYAIKTTDGKTKYDIHETYSFVEANVPQTQMRLSRVTDSQYSMESVHSGLTHFMVLNSQRRARDMHLMSPLMDVDMITVFAYMVVGRSEAVLGDVKYWVLVKEIPYEAIMSRTKFMSVEYTHPQMEVAIPLNIPNGMLISGNILFTPVFVLRALKYQPLPFIFDMDYRIKLMDADINMLELKSDECIKLTDTSYRKMRTVDVYM